MKRIFLVLFIFSLFACKKDDLAVPSILKPKNDSTRTISKIKKAKKKKKKKYLNVEVQLEGSNRNINLYK